MSEAFLQYIWQHQLYLRENLRTTAGEKVEIHHPGVRNNYAGPDFLDCRVKIGDMQWVGSCEIHLKSKSWKDHAHHQDPLYAGVVLHVVWEDNRPVQHEGYEPIPTLELGGRVDHSLILRWRELAHSRQEIPCLPHLPSVPEKFRRAALEDGLQQRLAAKANETLRLYVQNRHDWLETCYQVLMRCFGFKVNAEPFYQLALVIPGKLWRKRQQDWFAVRVLFWGGAGLLHAQDTTPEIRSMWREYRFLQLKYPQLERGVHHTQWKRMKLRPANFPEVRLDQVSWLLAHRPQLLRLLTEPVSLEELVASFTIPTGHPVAPLGKASIFNLITNLTLLLGGAYRHLHPHESLPWVEERLRAIPPEQNHVLRKFPKTSFVLKNSSDSQGILGLHDYKCLRHQCLGCPVGMAIVNQIDNDSSKNKLSLPSGPS